MSIKKCHNVRDFRALAKKRLPASMFHYIDGGADDEYSLNRNTDAFGDYELINSVLRDVSEIDLTTKLLGTEMAMPLFCSPTGMTRLFHHEKELGVARAAATAGIMYSLSAIATTTIEDAAEVHPGPKMFQVYMFKDRGLVREFVARCKAANYDALCLTVDTPVAGNRERDLVHGMSLPPKFTLASLLDFAMHPSWSLRLLTDPGFTIANVAHRVDALDKKPMGLIQYVNTQLDKTISWDDAQWLKEEWGGPFVLKGLMSVGDARRAVDIGVDAIMISNHGGRQMDTVPAPVDRLQPIRDAIGDALELIVDGGVRRGTHVLKALALGANACSFGRPYLWGLAAAGEKGVDRVFELMRAELLRDMQIMGCRNIAEITPDQVQRRG